MHAGDLLASSLGGMWSFHEELDDWVIALSALGRFALPPG